MKLLIVDDHHLIREGLKPVLRRLGDGEEAQFLRDVHSGAPGNGKDGTPYASW